MIRLPLGLRKVIRYGRLYGPRKTLFKAQGRSRNRRVMPRPRRARERDVGVIGCGQFAFATIGYHLVQSVGNRFAACFDPDDEAAATFASFYRIDRPSADAHALIESPAVRTIYIASNHASHSEYAQAALRAGRVAYVEKPVAVNRQQLHDLCLAVTTTGGRIHAGYNRPFARAIRDLRRALPHPPTSPLTLDCFVAGHQLPSDHWYRDPGEGTRICGNMGHWLDLAVHLLAWGTIPDRWRIRVVYGDLDARDDNVTVSLASSRGDLVVITLTSRSEPFEGITEFISLQWGDASARIDDFRRMTIWSGPRRSTRRYWPKDVGHARAITQPFREPERVWSEVVMSTCLMLEVMEMTVLGEESRDFSLRDAMASLGVSG